MSDRSWYSFFTVNRHQRAERFLTRLFGEFTALERLLFWIFALALIATSTLMLVKVSNSFMVATPARGGTLTEGIVGSPRFINPLLAISDTDRDLSQLIFSGLMRIGADGTLSGALAESYEVSDDGLTYTFILRDDAYFHDGTPVTASDVVFTVERAQHPALKSPKRANFEGVFVQAENDRTVVFTLPKPYSPFLENLTLGILPKHIWQDIDPEQFPFSKYNMEPIGAGPFKLSKVGYDGAGIPVSMSTSAFNNYVLGTPYLSGINFKFMSGESQLSDALRKGEIESASGLSPQGVALLASTTNIRIEDVPLPRVFGVFWNQSNAPVLAHAEVRRALALAIDRDAVIDAAIAGYGTPIDGPFAGEFEETEIASTSEPAAILERNGWERGEDGIYVKETKSAKERLAFSLSVPNTPELRAAADELEARWRALGVDVSVKVFESGDISQAVIRPREYEALLFGIVVGRELDLYAFWHSSQRNDPGLNIAQYANIDADKWLEEARAATDAETIKEKNMLFAREVKKDDAALFLYMPDFLYVLPRDVEGTSFQSIASPSERFALVHTWYRKKDYVWQIFANKTN